MNVATAIAQNDKNIEWLSSSENVAKICHNRELQAEREEIQSQIISFFEHAVILSGNSRINYN